METKPATPATTSSRRSRLAIASLVLGSMAILVLVLMPATKEDSWPGKMTRALFCGKQIFTATFGLALNVTTNGDLIGWPKSAEFSTSTAVFTNLVRRGVLKVDYSFFAAQGITPCRNTNATLFKAENNAWCVVADLKGADPKQTPFLMTRNLRVSNLAELKGKVGDQLGDEPPFGRTGLPIVFKGGAAEFLKSDMLWSNILGGQTFTNRVLRP
ncbi:MAG: hypothetical protein NTY53_25230 [Kiritimatiellaeota bacterium]|nr:hypothetical protein [Kiritimatiellota bacterium]